MRYVDRILVVVLIVGVWALVLKPSAPSAHDDNGHNCDISGYLSGQLDDTDVTVDGDYGEVDSGSVSISGVSGLDVSCNH